MVTHEFHLNRRTFLMNTGTAASTLGLGDRPDLLHAQGREPTIDHTIRIGPVFNALPTLIELTSMKSGESGSVSGRGDDTSLRKTVVTVKSRVVFQALQ